MSLTRRVLFYLFVCIFFVGGASILFMAQGYRYSIQKGRVERTGEISVDSRPKGARILVDGVPPLSFIDKLKGKKDVTTPAHIQAVLSGQYRVTIEKDGSFPWTQEVTVLPGRAAVLADIALLPRPAATVTSLSSTIVKMIPLNGSRLVFQAQDDKIGFYDTRSKSLDPLFDPHERISSLLVSPSGRSVLVQGISHLWIVRSDGRVQIARIPRLGFKQFSWSRAEDLYALDESGVALLSFQKKAFSSILPGSFSEISADDTLIAIDRAKTMRIFEIAKANHPILLTSARAPEGILRSRDNGYIVFSDVSHDNLFLVDKKNSKKIPLRIPHAHSLRWLTSTAGVVWDDFEVSTFTLDERGVTSSLVTRQSEPIADVVAVRGIPYVLIVTKKGSVDALDISGNDPNNRYHFFDDSTRVTQAVDEGKVIVIAGSFKSSPGITLVSLQD